MNKSERPPADVTAKRATNATATKRAAVAQPQPPQPRSDAPHHTRRPALRRWRRRIFAASWLSYFSFYFTRKHFSVAKSSLALSESMLQWIDFAYLVAYMLGMFGNGLLGEKLGPRRLVTLGMLASATVTLAFAGAEAITLHLAMAYLLLSAANGFAQSAGWPGNGRLMASWFAPEERGVVMGWWSTCYQAGGVVASLAAAALLNIGGWRLAYIGVATWVGLVAVLFWFAVRDTPSAAELPQDQNRAIHGTSAPAQGAADADAAATGAADTGAAATDAAATAKATAPHDSSANRTSRPSPLAHANRTAGSPPATSARADATAIAAHGNKRAAMRALFRNPMTYAFGACYFALKLMRYGFLFWLPFYLNRALGFDKTTAATMSIAFDLGGIPFAVLAGVVADRICGGRRVAVACGAAVGLFFALWAYRAFGANSAALNVGLLMGVGAFLFAADTLISGAAAQDLGGPAAAGLACGVINGIGSAGAVTQALTLVAIKNRVGWDGVFFLFQAMALVAAVVLLPFWRTRPVDTGAQMP